ncbi:MAG: hypothetical protein AB7G08_32640 [Hyphomicrobiaceae bacterium]
MTKRRRRQKHVDRIMRNAWGSLITHLDAIERRDRDGDDWHEQAIREYAEIILAASQLY